MISEFYHAYVFRGDFIAAANRVQTMFCELSWVSSINLYTNATHSCI